MTRAAMTPDRAAELIRLYAFPGATLADAERAASGFAWTLDESQPVDDETLSADIDEMREELGAQ
jgi:hypothetical protein